MARFANSTFASLQVTADDERNFTEWVAKNSDSAFDHMTRLLGDGFKVSCSWIVDSNAFCFSLIGTEATKKHNGMVMTSWSDDLAEVIFLAAYKHYVMCDGQEWPVGRAGTRWG